MTKRILAILLSATMIVTFLPVFAIATSAEVYRPYDLTLTEDSIVFKEDVNVSDNVIRWDMFILAGSSGETAPIRVDINEFDAEGFKLYEGYCIKANGNSEVPENPGATCKKLDDDTFEITIIPSKINGVKFLSADKPYIWLVVAPGDAFNRLDQSKGTSGQYDVYNSTVCLGRFESMENFKEVNPSTAYAITNGTPESAKETNHGYISINKESAAEGNSVGITVSPNKGYQIKSLAATYFDGEQEQTCEIISIKGTFFVMPAYDVTVTAEFEKVPVSGGKTLPYSFDFETDMIAEGWENFDADGDGQDWITGTNKYGTQGFGVDASNCAISQSYDNDIGSFNSDNWLFSPPLIIPEGGATISWYEESQDSSYPDSYMVYVAECVGEEAVASVYDVDTNPTGTTVELYSGVAENPWAQCSVELSAEEYGGKTVYIAFRHLSEDCYILNIDNFAAEEKSAPHTHTFTYTADGGVITATCEEGCEDGLDENPLTLTLIAPASLVYDGNAKAFTFAADEADAWEEAGLELPDIIYCIKQSGQSEYLPLFGTLKDVGNYMAQITVDGETAQVEFSINKGMPYIETNPAPSDITFGEKLSNSTLFGGYAQVSSTNSTQIAGLFEWTEPDTVPAIADSDVTLYDVTFTPVDEQNYMAVTCQVTITVKHTHAPVLVEGQAATGVTAGFKDYYECICGEYYEDAAGSVLIPDLNVWKAEGGAGYIPPLSYVVTDFNGDPVQPGENTYLEKEDGVHVYAFDLFISGEIEKNLIMEPSCGEIYLEELTVGGNLIAANGEGSIVVHMTDSVVEGDFVATKGEEDMYPCIHATGSNAIKGNVVSDTTFTLYGEPGATLQVGSVKASDYMLLQNARLENVKEDYVFGETTTLTPEDESKPIVLTVKATVTFESEDTFIINDGKPFAFGEDLEIGTPTVFDENGVAFDPQPELDITYYAVLDDGATYERVDGVPAEEGDYCVFFSVSESNPDYCGVGSYLFSIGHNITKVEGKEATETEAGYKEYYVCEGCNTYYEDEAGEKPIEDLDAWKAEGGAGYIAPIEPTILLGDANDDGFVDMKDVLTIRKYVAEMDVHCNLVNADCNEDESIDMQDVLLLRKFLAKLVDALGAQADIGEISA